MAPPRREIPSVGRIVHYVLAAGDPIRPHAVGQHVAAMIVAVLGDPELDGVECNLLLFLDGLNQGTREAVQWVGPRGLDQGGKGNRTWHFPERVEPANPSPATAGT